MQDLAGWDFDFLQYLSKSTVLEIRAVGDFRQTLYHTVSSPKKPSTQTEKLDFFQKMGFVKSDLNESKRSILTICNFSDLIHSGDGYIATASNVNVPQGVEHYGLYSIFEEDVESYINQINPLVLRDSKRSGQYLPKNCNVMNFGESKGLTADHVLIISTNPILNFLQGKENSFVDKTGIGRNRAYVAITRARYSVAFVVKKHTTYLPMIVNWQSKD